jgi:predicted MFS family arabinose efflux permease
VLTIVTYGAAFYAFGVLIAPIAAETHWPQAALGAIFSGVLLITGIGGILAGGVLDRFGEQPLFAVAATLGAGALLVAASQTRLLGFALSYAVGCGLIGALGFYHITQTVAARVAPVAPAKAIIRLTLLGALAGPVYLPLTAWLCSAIGWRGAVRVEAVSVAAAFVVTLLFVRGRGERPSRSEGSRDGALRALRRALRDRPMQRWLAATLLAGAATDAILLYQVPAMVSLGLPLSIAASLAGFRGAAQFAGRLPLGPIVTRLGSRRTVVVDLFVVALAAPLLFFSAHLVGALAFSFIVGAATGAFSALQGIYTHELADPAHLGALLGTQQALFEVGGALGPVTAGVLLGVTGSYAPMVVAVSGGLIAAGLLLVAWPRRTVRSLPREVSPGEVTGE